jgi:hypothetical protein
MAKTFTEAVVSGNTVEVGEGHQVPANCRIIPIKSIAFSIDLSSLIRESQPIK